MSGVGAIIGAIGGGIGAAGSAFASQEEHDSLIDNAEFYTEAAIEERMSAIDRERVARQKQAEQRGRLIANVHKAGVTLSGSALEVLSENLRRSEEDILAIRRQGDVAVNTMQRRARNARHKARYVRLTFRIRMTSTYFGSGGASALQNAGQQRDPTVPGKSKTGLETQTGDWWGNNASQYPEHDEVDTENNHDEMWGPNYDYTG